MGEDKQTIPNSNFAVIARRFFLHYTAYLYVLWTDLIDGDAQGPNACCRPLQLLFQQLGRVRGEILVQNHFDLVVASRLLHWTSREHRYGRDGRGFDASSQHRRPGRSSAAG